MSDSSTPFIAAYSINDRVVRPVSATVNSLQRGNAQRPASEVLSQFKSPEAEAIDRWFEDLSYYEQTLEQMARAKLDDNFCEELNLLQKANGVQIRFFITVLQQMAQKDPTTGVVPAPDQIGKPYALDVHSMPPRVSSSTTAPQHVLISPPDTDRDGFIVDARATQRLFDRNSATIARETGREASKDYVGYQYQMRAASPTPSSSHHPHMPPLARPQTPVDEAIASADWSLNPTIRAPIARPGGGLGNGTFSPVLGVHEDVNSITLQAPRSPYGRPLSPRPMSPVILSPPANDRSWAHIDSRPRTPNSQYARSDYGHSDFGHSDDGAGGHYDRNGMHGAHKEKGKIPESVDIEALNDIPSWLRSLRLHKYSETFDGMHWKDMIVLDDSALQAKGVGASGARKKLLKVFELVRQDLGAKNIKY
ncbi:hypothetical protein HKX48_007918 [Thoreauomyces humboldtii]|nr:hypothetical protein HKX48_007918 [Thoreauomyces humboldtii]